MNDKKIQTLDDVRAFLEGATEVDFSIEGKDERYKWIRQTLVRFKYLSLSRLERGVVLRYLERVSGYSRQTVTRLVEQYRKSGKGIGIRGQTTIDLRLIEINPGLSPIISCPQLFQFDVFTMSIMYACIQHLCLVP